MSDEIILSLLSKRLEAGEVKGESGFILDGFPRTIKQAVSCQNWCLVLGFDSMTCYSCCMF